MERRVGTLLLLIALGCSACAKVGVEFDPGQDFTGFQRWAWLPRLEAPPSTQLAVPDGLVAEIEARVEHALAERGFQRVSEEQADFFVTYHVEVFTDVVFVQETPPEQHVASLNNSPSYGVTTMEHHQRVYERGRLVIDVADSTDRQLVWRGSTESKYRGSWKPHAGDAVLDILERFPPES
ncbi:MAG: DUF4136 domain-containing protein [Myxococcota bacterium]